MTEFRSSFPANFAWGTATAATQIEGAAFTDGKGLSVWDTFSRSKGKILNGDTADVHHPQYNFNDEVIPVGASYWAELVETRMPAR